MKKRLILSLIHDIRDSARNGVPHDLHFKPLPDMTAEQRKDLQDALNQSFDIWRRSWILPQLDQLERLIQEKPKAGDFQTCKENP